MNNMQSMLALTTGGAGFIETAREPGPQKGVTGWSASKGGARDGAGSTPESEFLALLVAFANANATAAASGAGRDIVHAVLGMAAGVVPGASKVEGDGDEPARGRASGEGPDDPVLSAGDLPGAVAVHTQAIVSAIPGQLDAADPTAGVASETGVGASAVSTEALEAATATGGSAWQANPEEMTPVGKKVVKAPPEVSPPEATPGEHSPTAWAAQPRVAWDRPAVPPAGAVTWQNAKPTTFAFSLADIPDPVSEPSGVAPPGGPSSVDGEKQRQPTRLGRPAADSEVFWPGAAIAAMSETSTRGRGLPGAGFGVNGWVWPGLPDESGFGAFTAQVHAPGEEADAAGNRAAAGPTRPVLTAAGRFQPAGVPVPVRVETTADAVPRAATIRQQAEVPASVTSEPTAAVQPDARGATAALPTPNSEEAMGAVEQAAKRPKPASPVDPLPREASGPEVARLAGGDRGAVLRDGILPHVARLSRAYGGAPVTDNSDVSVNTSSAKPVADVVREGAAATPDGLDAKAGSTGASPPETVDALPQSTSPSVQPAGMRDTSGAVNVAADGGDDADFPGKRRSGANGGPDGGSRDEKGRTGSDLHRDSSSVENGWRMTGRTRSSATEGSDATAAAAEETNADARTSSDQPPKSRAETVSGQDVVGQASGTGAPRVVWHSRAETTGQSVARVQVRFLPEELGQVIRQAVYEPGNDASTFRVQLVPEHLGQLHVKVTLEQGQVVNAQFLVENQAAKQVLEASLPQLNNSLNALGLAIGGFSVALGFGGSRGEGMGSLPGSAVSEIRRGFRSGKTTASERDPVDAGARTARRFAAYASSASDGEGNLDVWV